MALRYCCLTVIAIYCNICSTLFSNACAFRLEAQRLHLSLTGSVGKASNIVQVASSVRERCKSSRGHELQLTAGIGNFGSKVGNCVGKWMDWSEVKPTKWSMLSDEAFVMGQGANAIGLIVPFAAKASPKSYASECGGAEVAVKIAAAASANANATRLSKKDFSSSHIVHLFGKEDPRIIHTNDGESIFMQDFVDHNYINVKVLALEAGDVDLDRFAHFEVSSQGRHEGSIRGNERASPVAVASIALDVLLGLKVLHDHSYVHGDVKPSNILLMCNPRLSYSQRSSFALGRSPEILKRCVAKLADMETACRVKMQMLGGCPSGIGTEGFLSPSLLQGGKRNRRDDLWALGISLLSLTGDRNQRGSLLQSSRRADRTLTKPTDIFRFLGDGLPQETNSHKELFPLLQSLMYPTAKAKVATAESVNISKALIEHLNGAAELLQPEDRMKLLDSSDVKACLER